MKAFHRHQGAVPAGARPDGGDRARRRQRLLRLRHARPTATTSTSTSGGRRAARRPGRTVNAVVDGAAGRGG